MEFSLSELIDTERMDTLLEEFTLATDTATALLDIDGNILCAAGWKDICVKFHRVHSKTKQRCLESDTSLASRLKAGNRFNVYKCMNGLVDVATPILIEDEHLGNVFIGQFLFEAPDEEFFIKQAREYGFNESAYLAALREVPIFSEERVKYTLGFLTELTELIGEMGATQKRQLLLNREIKSSAEALLESEKKYRNLLENLPQKIFIKDNNSVYVSCNDNYARDLGITAAEIEGKTDYDFYPVEMAEKYREDDARILKAKRTVELKETYEINGQRYTVQTLKVPIKNEQGEAVAIQGIFWDITASERAVEEKSKLEEQLRHSQKMDAIGQLAGGIAHDFNNMLGGILGSAEILSLELDGNKDLLKHVNIILQSSERAAELTRKLLTFSRRGSFESKVVSVHEAIHKTVELLEHTIDKNISIHLSLAADDCHIDGDISQIESGLLNLGINARDAMPRGGRLSFGTSTVELDEVYCRKSTFDLSPGTYIDIEVRDTGCGIPSDKLSEIFNPFFTTKKIGSGTGLGLASVYGTVQAHKGAISVYSVEGEGTVFHLYLPIKKGLEVSPLITDQVAIGKGSGCVLVIDDEEVIRLTTEELLNRLGYEVLLARDGFEGVSLYEKEKDRIVLVLLDMIMPGMTGTECFYKLKEINDQVKVVLSSGFTKDENTCALMEQGLSGFLRKPYTRVQLSRLLAEQLP